MTKFSWKKGDFTITPYGWLWGNTVYSTERTSPGTYTLFVQSASSAGKPAACGQGRNLTQIVGNLTSAVRRAHVQKSPRAAAVFAGCGEGESP